MFMLPEELEIPGWYTLLIDSRGALPHVGTALVLAATALEVFISDLLNKLARDSTIPVEMWDWINDRGNWQKEPSVEEQYDVLLKLVTGHSLKEESNLWEALKNLRNARNSFVHEGVPRIKRGSVISADETSQFILKAEEIVAKIREWISEKQRWPAVDHRIQVTLMAKISSSSSVARDNIRLIHP